MSAAQEETERTPNSLSTPSDDAAKAREVVRVGTRREASLDGAWSVGVMVVDALGAPVADAKVDLSATQKGRVLSTVFTDSSGRAALVVSADRAFVRAYHEHVGRSIAVDVVDRRGLETRLLLGRPASMTALVLDSLKQPVAGQLVRILDEADRYHGCPRVSPRTVSTDVFGRFEFEAQVGVRVTVGRELRTAFVAHEGGDVVSLMPEEPESLDGALEWRCDYSYRVPGRVGNDYASSSALPQRKQEPFWIDVVMRGGAPEPHAGLYWIGPSSEAPTQFYAKARDGNRYRLNVHDVKRKPMQLLVRGSNGYSETLSFDQGALPTRIGVALQPPGDIEIQVLHRGQRARGVHTELTSWGKRATAHLDADGIARYAMVHHGLMNVRVMRGQEVLAARQVHVPGLGTAHAIVHVDLSR